MRLKFFTTRHEKSAEISFARHIWALGQSQTRVFDFNGAVCPTFPVPILHPSHDPCVGSAFGGVKAVQPRQTSL